MEYNYIITDSVTANGVLTITLNRPKDLNAINLGMMEELLHALELAEKEDSVRVIMLTGGAVVFAAGADIKEMEDVDLVQLYKLNQFKVWDRIKTIRKPIVAAVAGFALGGGCELAMSADMIVAADNAQFGQPEIKIGVIPGAGGTQRLTRSLGKQLAMEMILTGKFIGADEAFKRGLVNKVVPLELLLSETLKLCNSIASMAPLAVQMAKEAVLKAFETSLTEGMEFERRQFYMLFATQDQKEGMQAFVNKTKPNFKGN